jgi:hypothetical protein
MVPRRVFPGRFFIGRVFKAGGVEVVTPVSVGFGPGGNSFGEVGGVRGTGVVDSLVEGVPRLVPRPAPLMRLAPPGSIMNRTGLKYVS